jgi:RNA polymerase sigma factor (sigma-70 family)
VTKDDMWTESDGAVIARSHAEPREFGQVFERHFDSIHRYITRRLGPTFADDLAAETFSRAFAQRDRFDTCRCDARPWLFGIAANVLRGYYRTEERALRAYARTGVDPLDFPETDAVIARVDAGAAAPCLASALASLNPADRDVLLLFAWGDLSYAEIAEALNIPLGTVRSRLHRARGRVSDALRQAGFGRADARALDGQEVSHG